MNAFYVVLLNRGLTVAAGFASLYFGYRLFSIATEKQGEFSLQLAADRKLTMINLGPGIYFAFLGTIILGLNVYYPPSFSSEQDGPRLRTTLYGDSLSSQVATPDRPPSFPIIGDPPPTPSEVAPPVVLPRVPSSVPSPTPGPRPR